MVDKVRGRILNVCWRKLQRSDRVWFELFKERREQIVELGNSWQKLAHPRSMIEGMENKDFLKNGRPFIQVRRFPPNFFYVGLFHVCPHHIIYHLPFCRPFLFSVVSLPPRFKISYEFLEVFFFSIQPPTCAPLFCAVSLRTDKRLK